MDYPHEQFTTSERALLEPHFTNLDRPVFCVVDLPEVVKGALFARYSRYPGTLRRLYLDEFVEDGEGHPATNPPAQAEGVSAGGPYSTGSERAERLYERVFLEFGDDSVAQLGGAHLACEWASNVLTKILQRGRLAAYLEQSTRYIAYDQRLEDGRYRYYRDARLGERYEQSMERIFDLYSAGLEHLQRWGAEQFPRGDEPEAVWARSIKAKALDAMRGLLPAASLSHVGIFASGQAYEQLVMRLLASPLPEARVFGEMALEELREVIPAFVRRVDMPDRGGAWIEYLRGLRERASAAVARYGLSDEQVVDQGPSVRLLHHEGGEDDLIAACLYESCELSEDELRAAAGGLDGDERASLIAELVGDRANRRHKPGRGWEALRYRFEIVSDYGAFRDLQRHRLLSCEWQRLGCELGADVPEEVTDAGYGDAYRKGLEVSRAEFERLRGEGLTEEATYTVSLAYRVRYLLDLNAREAMHLIELRSGREGHPSYRAVALEMLDQIVEVHPSVGAAMTFVDRETEPRLERLQGELRRHRRLQGLV
ncbi:MAG: FAD-dependent thymidylate synthase [Solirubrobacterales bacterium]